jgi:tetratricopeptide (TPR) repeat protein
MLFARHAVVLILFLTFFVATWTQTGARSDDRRRAIDLFEKGQEAQERGDNAGAVRLYTGAITADPSLYQAHYQRSIAYLATGKTAEAETDLRRVLQLAPEFARAHRALGQLLLDRGDTDEAKLQLARAVELEPSLPGVRVYYASALIKTGDPVRAAEQLRLAIQQGDSPAFSNALLGVAEERQGNIEAAMEAYSRAIELNPDEPTAREGRARLLAERGELARAIEDYSIAYRNQPTPQLAMHLAELYSRTGQPQAAIRIYRHLLIERPEDMSLRLSVIRLLLVLDEKEEAAREIGSLLRAHGTNVELLVLAGDLYSRDQPQESAGYYKRALELQPDDNEIRVQYAASLVRSRRFVEALPVLSDALRRDSANYQARANLATALFELKQYPRAAAEFLWLVRTKPDAAVAYYFLAISLDRMGDCPQALKAYELFLQKANATSNKKEIDDASIRVGLLRKLVKDKKCKSPSK